MSNILYLPWVERHIKNENKKAAESELYDSENPDVIEQLIINGRVYES